MVNRFSPFLNDCAVVVAVQAEKLWLSLITQDIIMQSCWSGENKIDGNLQRNFTSLTVRVKSIERGWKLTRAAEATHNRYFSTFAELTHSIEKVFNTWGNGNNILNKTCAII